MGSKQSHSDSNMDLDGKQLAAKIMKERPPYTVKKCHLYTIEKCDLHTVKKCDPHTIEKCDLYPVKKCDKPIDVKIRCPHCKSWRTHALLGFDYNRRTCMYCGNQFTITDCEQAIPAPQLKDDF